MLAVLIFLVLYWLCEYVYFIWSGKFSNGAKSAFGRATLEDGTFHLRPPCPLPETSATDLQLEMRHFFSGNTCCVLSWTELTWYVFTSVLTARTQTSIICTSRSIVEEQDVFNNRLRWARWVIENYLKFLLQGIYKVYSSNVCIELHIMFRYMFYISEIITKSRWVIAVLSDSGYVYL